MSLLSDSSSCSWMIVRDRLCAKPIGVAPLDGLLYTEPESGPRNTCRKGQKPEPSALRVRERTTGLKSENELTSPKDVA